MIFICGYTDGIEHDEKDAAFKLYQDELSRLWIDNGQTLESPDATDEASVIDEVRRLSIGSGYMLRTLKREAIRFSPMILAAAGFFCLYMANVPGSSRLWGCGAIWTIVATVPAMIFSLEVSHSRT